MTIIHRPRVPKLAIKAAKLTGLDLDLAGVGLAALGAGDVARRRDARVHPHAEAHARAGLRVSRGSGV